MGRSGRPKSGEGVGETENCRIYTSVYADVARVANIRSIPTSQVVSPAIQQWLATEFPKAIREVRQIADTPTMMPRRAKNSREEPVGPASTVRLPTWDIYRLNVIASIRGSSVSAILADLLGDWVKLELVKAMREEAARLGLTISDGEDDDKPKKKAK